MVWTQTGKVEGISTSLISQLNKKRESWKPLLEAVQECDVTLVFSARDTEHNKCRRPEIVFRKEGQAARKPSTKL